jgi:hypothetical protein
MFSSMVHQLWDLRLYLNVAKLSLFSLLTAGADLFKHASAKTAPVDINSASDAPSPLKLPLLPLPLLLLLFRPSPVLCPLPPLLLPPVMSPSLPPP